MSPPLTSPKVEDFVSYLFTIFLFFQQYFLMTPLLYPPSLEGGLGEAAIVVYPSANWLFLCTGAWLNFPHKYHGYGWCKQPYQTERLPVPSAR